MIWPLNLDLAFYRLWSLVWPNCDKHGYSLFGGFLFVCMSNSNTIFLIGFPIVEGWLVMNICQHNNRNRSVVCVIYWLCLSSTRSVLSCLLWAHLHSTQPPLLLQLFLLLYRRRALAMTNLLLSGADRSVKHPVFFTLSWVKESTLIIMSEM